MSQIGLVINVKEGIAKSRIKSRECNTSDISIAIVQLEILKKRLIKIIEDRLPITEVKKKHG